MKRNFLLMLLLTLLPFVGWAEVTFRIGNGTTDLPNPYYVASDAEANFTVTAFSDGQALAEWTWSKKDASSGDFTVIYDPQNVDADWNLCGKVDGPGEYKLSGVYTSAGEIVGYLTVIVGTEPKLVIKLNGTEVTETSVSNFGSLEAYYTGITNPVDVTWTVNTGTDAAPNYVAPATTAEPGKYRAAYNKAASGTPDYVYAYVTLNAEQGGATTSNELMVQPQTTCVMFWGQPFALTAKDIIVTPSASATTEVKEAILKKIKINENLSSREQELGFKDFTIGLIDALTDEGRQITVDGTKYTINITGPGKVDIRKGTNILEEGWKNVVVLADGLVFNGGAQVLAEAADYTFTSYSAATEGSEYARGKVAVNGEPITVQEIVDEKYVSVDYTGIKVLTNTPANENDANAATFVGKTFYVKGNPNNLPTGRLQLYSYEKKDGKDVFTEVPVWVEVVNTKFTTYAGAYKFFSISAADYQKAFEDAAVAAAQEAKGETPLTEEEIAAAKATAITNMPTPDLYEFGKAKPVLNETWGNEGKLPTGTNAGKYYVWVQAADGGLMYEGGQIAYVGATTIAKATPTFAGPITGVEETYYLFTETGSPLNWKNLRTTKDADDKPVPAIVPAGPYRVSIGNWSIPVDPEKDKIRYYVQKGTKVTVNNKDEIHYAWTTDVWSGRTLDNFAGFEEGYYRILAQFLGDDNLNPAGLNNGETRVAAEFVVSKPTAIIQTTIKGQTEATYAYSVKPLKGDYSYTDSWPAYKGTLNGPSKEEAPYNWYTKNAQDEYVPANPDENGNYTYGTYYILPEEYGENGLVNPFSVSGDDFAEPIVKPAVVFVTATNILAKVENQELVYGQELPLKLKYSQGAYTPNTEKGAKLIKEFEDYMWPSGFTATNTETGEEIKLYSEEAYTVTTGGVWGTPRVETKYYTTTILPVGTYTVTADVAKGDEFTVLAAEGTWTVTAKDINNEDFGDWTDPYDRYDTPEPRVKGMGGSFSLNETYTSKEITLYELGEDSEGNVTVKRNELDGKFTYRKGMIAIAGDLTPEQREAEINKQSGFYYGSLVPGRDFEITSYTNNINAGEATFHVKGIGNFKGEKDLTFTIDKALIFVFPDKYNGVNKWTVGSPQEDAFQVDWEGKNKVDVVYKNKTYNVPTGIKYQLHAFENDRPLVKPEIVNSNGFKDLKVQFIVGATVGEYAEGLKAYQDVDETTKKIVPADNYEFVFQTAPLTIEQGTIVLAVADFDAVNAPTYKGTTRPREKNAAGKFVLAPADKQVQPLDPALQQQWWKYATDKDKDGNAWAITWEDNLDDPELKQEIAGTDPKAYRYRASDALPEGKSYKIKCTAFPKGTYENTNYKFVIAEGAYEAPLTVKRADATISVWAGVDAPEPTNEIHKNYNDFILEAAKNHTTAENEKAAWMATIGQIKDKDGNIIGNSYVKIDGLQPGDKYTDLVASVAVNDDNEIIITAVDNKNYNIDEEDGIVNGTLVIDPVEGTLALYSNPVEYFTDEYGDYTDETGHDLPAGDDPVVKNPFKGSSESAADLFVLQAYDKVPVEAVTIKLKAATLDPENEAYSEWKAGQWHTMVLPFATTVGEIAYNFKYAIVNVVDVNATNAATKPNEVHFMLQEIMDEIPANTPFMIKSQYDFDYDNTLLYFGNVDGALAKKLGDTNPIYIEYDAKPSVEAGKTYTFEGTYDQMVIDKNTLSYKFIGPDNRWKQFSETSTSKYTLQPYAGYLNLQGLTGTREVVCFFEEEDGSTTAINAAELQNVKSAEGLYRVDGIKLQSAPTQKGVYIQNGKKFVK